MRERSEYSAPDFTQLKLTKVEGTMDKNIPLHLWPHGHENENDPFSLKSKRRLEWIIPEERNNSPCETARKTSSCLFAIVMVFRIRMSG